MLTLRSVKPNNTMNSPGIPQITVDMFTKDIFVSLVIAVGVFVLGYFIVLKKSVK